MRYELNKYGHRTMNLNNGQWFAYATGLLNGDVSRGEGKTEMEAIENSINNTEMV